MATSVVVVCLALTLTGLAAQGPQPPQQGQPVPQQILDLQRSYEVARVRRQPVTHLLADAFIEIRPDGRLLNRTQAVDQYATYDDPSAVNMDTLWTAMYRDVAIIAGRAGEEGSSDTTRRLYVWVRGNEDWRLLVFQRTFLRSPNVILESRPSVSPFIERQNQPVLPEEETLASRDLVPMGRLVPDGARLINRYAEELTGSAWLMQLAETKGSPSLVRDFSILSRSDTTVIVGTEVSRDGGEVSRFTRIWTPGSESMQLQISQSTPVAVALFSR